MLKLFGNHDSNCGRGNKVENMFGKNFKRVAIHILMKGEIHGKTY